MRLEAGSQAYIGCHIAQCGCRYDGSYLDSLDCRYIAIKLAVFSPFWVLTGVAIPQDLKAWGSYIAAVKI